MPRLSRLCHPPVVTLAPHRPFIEPPPPPPLPADDDDDDAPAHMPADPAYAAMHQAGAAHAALAQPDEAADEQPWAAVGAWEVAEEAAGGSYGEEEPADHEEQ